MAVAEVEFRKDSCLGPAGVAGSAIDPCDT